MSALPLDPIYNDLVFVGGGLTLVASNSIAETVQELNCRFGFGKSEWFLDLQQGFPWIGVVMVKNPDIRAIAQMLRRMILDTPGVRAVLALPITLDTANRVLRWSAQIQHATGNYITGGYGKPFVVATGSVGVTS